MLSEQVTLPLMWSNMVRLKVLKSGIDTKDITTVFQNDTQNSNTFDEFYEIGKTLTRGLQTVKVIRIGNKRKANINFPIVNIDGQRVNISNITVIVDSPGKYGLIFGINGVFTDIKSDLYTVDISDDITFIEQYPDLFEALAIVVFYFLILFFASKISQGYLLLAPLFLITV